MNLSVLKENGKEEKRTSYERVKRNKDNEQGEKKMISNKEVNTLPNTNEQERKT